MTTPPLPEGRFACVYADPAWPFQGYSGEVGATIGNKGDGRRHYKPMSLEAIAALPVADIVAKDAWLFMWITSPLELVAAHLPIMKAWGFKPSAVGFTWVKIKRGLTEQQLRIIRMADHNLHLGRGLTTRKNTERCLIGRRGSPKRLSASVREVILAPIREHSRKPDEARERIERFCEGPYLELFARDTRAGWTSWGNEVGKFNTAGEAA